MDSPAICLPDQSGGVTPHSQRGHSRLGGSGAERWLNCPGSVGLLKSLRLPETDDPSYRLEGSAMHEAGALCLTTGQDAWETVGMAWEGCAITAPMANAVQMYLDYCRQFMGPEWRTYIEAPISSPVHPDYYGSCDFGAVWYGNVGPIRVVDLKGGEGIAVDAEHNDQLRYYAFGLVDGIERATGEVFPDEAAVIVAIVQPRGFHVLGPIREWEITVGELKAWVHTVLVPGMEATAWDHTLDAGEHCRFCPAKIVCPLMVSLFGAASTADPRAIVNLTDASLGRSFKLIDAVKHYLKALGEEVLRRGRAGHDLEKHGAKMVYQKTNRVWKDGAADLAKSRFGDDALTKPEVLSPPALEKLSTDAASFVKEFAYQPVGQLTVAPLSDPRRAVKVQPATEVFKAAITALEKSE